MPRARPDGPELKSIRGRWHIVWYDGNCRRTASTGTDNQSLARQALADFIASLERGPERLTVGAALDAYLKDKENVSVAWTRSCEAAIPLREGLGDLRIDQVTQDQWRRYAAKRKVKPHWRLTGEARKKAARNARSVAADTLKREFNTLRAALNSAIDRGWIDRIPKLSAPPSSRPRSLYITKEQARRLLDSAYSPHVKLFIALALGTGARARSILDLTWTRVDLDKRRIDFEDPDRKPTKKRRGVVPINDQLLAMLAEANAAAVTDYVIEWQGRPVKNGIRWPFAKAVKMAGLPSGVTPHILKHSVVSWLAMEGIPESKAADFLATDAATLRRVYRKFDPDYLAPVADALQF